MVPFLMVVLVFCPGRYPHFDLDLLGAEAEPTTAPKNYSGVCITVGSTGFLPQPLPPFLPEAVCIA